MKKLKSSFRTSFYFPLLAISLSMFGEKATPPLLDRETLQRIKDEVSGSICFEHIRQLSTLHRLWGSRDYHRAAGYFVDKSIEYGLKEANIEEFPIKTGRENFWMQSTGGFVPWDLKEGEVYLVEPFPLLISHYQSAPSTVAVCSRSTKTEAEVIYVGRGDTEEAYKGKSVKGKLVLAEGGRHEHVHELAVHRFGALGTMHFYNFQGHYHESEGIYWGRILPRSQDQKKPLENKSIK